YEDNSNQIILDEVLSRFVSLPNVLITSHQAFLTKEALENIAEATLKNVDAYFSGKELENEVCYHCLENPKECRHVKTGRCF
ncbi:MAG: 2-hydroxyacid dehydrogenase, partial [Hespellia sp.]|nr:2-hydroxyacid dehydrogenase [Hespellia sp.]